LGYCTRVCGPRRAIRAHLDGRELGERIHRIAAGVEGILEYQEIRARSIDDGAPPEPSLESTV
jgi:hypothetical protein